MNKQIMNDIKFMLIDVDDTLLDFQKSQDDSIIKAYEKYNIEITKEILDKYKELNVLLWKDYEKNLITTKEIFNERFNKLNKMYDFNVDGHIIEGLFRENLNNSWFILNDTIEFLEEAQKRYELIIVTNGKKETQDSRLELSGINKYFKHIFISEEVGYKKPEIQFFNHVECNVENFDKSKAIIIGDSLTSDIQGGINYGIKTCFFNPNNDEIKHNANLMVTSLKELL